MSANTSSPWYYSQLSRAIEQMPAKVDGTSGNNVSAWILANKGKLGVKADELEWTGVLDYLDLRGKEKVGKGDLLAYLNGNGVEVSETVLGGETGDVPTSYEELPKNVQALLDEYSDGNGDLQLAEFSQKAKNLGYEFSFDMAGDLESIVKIGSGAEPTKFHEYQLPGGKSYKELLLTLPIIDKKGNVLRAQRVALVAQIQQRTGKEFFTYDDMTDAESNDLSRIDSEFGGNKEFHDRAGPVFKSNHFVDQTNILAHIRFNERTDADGKKVLFIEELQSDWGQKGKKEGFVSRPDETTGFTADKTEKYGEPYWQVRDANGDHYYHIPATDAKTAEDAIHAAANKKAKVENDTRIPAAPFVTDTKAWTSLALKRMIAYAAENNFDKLAWANGEQQAARYDLSKQVDRIEVTLRDGGDRYVKLVKPHDDGLSFLANSDGVVVKGYGWEGKKVDEVVGKNVADKIMSAPGGAIIEGLDLKVGGEGMSAYYNQIVPQVANNILKKVGAGKVEMILIPQTPEVKLGKSEQNKLTKTVIDHSQNQPGFTITPLMREKVLAGMPLFQQDRGALDISTFTMSLFENADLSTFIHETGHFYLEVMSDLASQPNAPEAVKKDLRTAVEWMGVEGGVEGWKGLDFESRRPFHEKFARGFEAYLMTGEPPAPKLNGLFARAKGWLVSVYKDLSSLDVKLSPAVTGVFDRMVSADSGKETDTQAIREGLLSQLTAIDRFPAEVNETYASLVAGFYGSQAAAAGMTAEDMVRRYPLTIRNDVHGLVPEGIGRTVTDSAEFKGWFGESKVVGEDRKPLRVFHGTKIDFERFVVKFGHDEPGHFFASNPESANMYAGDASTVGGRVIPAFLSIIRPYKVTNLQWQNAEGLSPSEAKKQGYDGYVILGMNRGDDKSDSYLVFDSTQIKSVFNRGTFDPLDHNILHQSAFHGSPHDFDRFSLAHIGMGEGNQAYGWGLYFAESKDVAEHYRSALTVNSPDALQMHALGQGLPPELADTMAQFYAETRNSTFEDFASRVAEKSPSEYIEVFRDKYIRPSIGNGTAKKVWDSFRGAGQVYQVEIPDEGEYLLWDKPLSEQSNGIKETLKTIVPQYFEKGWYSERFNRPVSDSPEGGMSKLGVLADVLTGKSFYEGVADHPTLTRPPGDKAASQYLHSLGIAGIKYLDGSSRSAGEGNYNYVVFDDSRVEITEKIYPSLRSVPALLPADVKLVVDGGHFGKVLDVTADHVFQHIGRGKQVAYLRDQFVGLPAIGVDVRVSCKDGRAVVSEVGVEAKAISR